MLTHKEAFSHSNASKPPPECKGELVFYYNGFWSDVPWAIHQCSHCGKVVALVDGGVHWWNYEVEAPEMLEWVESAKKRAAEEDAALAR